MQSLVKHVTSLKFSSSEMLLSSHLHLLSFCRHFDRLIRAARSQCRRGCRSASLLLRLRFLCAGRYRPRQNPIKSPTRSRWRRPPSEVSISAPALAVCIAQKHLEQMALLSKPKKNRDWHTSLLLTFTSLA